MAWMALLALAVAWLLALLIVIAVRGKHLSWQFCILVLLCTTLGAGAVQYSLSVGICKIERLSAAHLVGVSSLRLKDDAEFIQNYLVAPLANGNGNQGDDAHIDWVGTFQMKARDISATFASVERNAFIRTNYSVWMADIEFHRGQLDRLAKHIVTVDEAIPRRTSVESYLVGLESAAELLDRLADEMRSRPPEAYYNDK